MKRLLKHLTFPRWRVHRAFPRAALKAIEAAVQASEKSHAGELRFVVEGGLELMPLLRGISARERALEAFSRLRVWDTEGNSGVLIYVQFADRRVEIVADRGIHRKVGDAAWQRICSAMEEDFRAGRFEAGALAGIEAIGRVLAEHFPAPSDNPDELPDSPVVL